PVDPRGFGAATIQPCAAHRAGFHRDDHPSSQAPCGPPWIRNTTGYFLAGSKPGGLSSQYCTRAPAAPTAVRLSGAAISVADLHSAFSRVSALDVPSAPTRKSSAGDVSVDVATTAKPAPGANAAIDPPLVTGFGAPPEAGTT